MDSVKQDQHNFISFSQALKDIRSNKFMNEMVNACHAAKEHIE